MVGYLKLLSTIVARGVNVNSSRSLPHQVLSFTSMPIFNVDWDLIVREFCAVRHGKQCDAPRFKRTWGILDTGFDIQLQGVPSKLIARNETAISNNNISIHFYAYDKRLHMSAHIPSADVIDTLPYNLTALGLLWNVVMQETKLKSGVLTVLIGNAWVPRSTLKEAKKILLQPVDKRTWGVEINKPIGQKYCQEHFSFIVKEVPKATFQ